MPFPAPIIQGVSLSDIAAVYYTVPSNDPRIKFVRVTSLRLVSASPSSQIATIYIVPKGGTVAGKYARLRAVPIPAEGLPDSSQFYVMDDVMLPGTTIWAVADAADVISFSVNGMTYP